MRDESGFTLIELLIAILLIPLALMALVSTLDDSRRLVTESEARETMTHQAEYELERILAQPYPSIALRSAPAASTDPRDPRFYATPGPPARYKWDQRPGQTKTENLVIDAFAGGLDPPAVAWQDGETRLSGEIHRFVTWTGDLCASCPGVQEAKRVTVAVTVNDRPRELPVLISSIKVNVHASG